MECLTVGNKECKGHKLFQITDENTLFRSVNNLTIPTFVQSLEYCIYYS